MSDEKSTKIDSSTRGQALGFGAHARVNLLINTSETSGIQEKSISTSLVIKQAIRPDFSPDLDREWIIGTHLPKSHYLVPFYQHGTQEDGCSFIVLPKLGPDLGKLVRQIGGFLSLSASLLVGVDLLDALSVFHSTGLVHCDVKPVCK